MQSCVICHEVRNLMDRDFDETTAIWGLISAPVRDVLQGIWVELDAEHAELWQRRFAGKLRHFNGSRGITLAP